MMDMQSIEKKIKYEIELFKVYALFIFGIGAGNISLYLTKAYIKDITLLVIFIIGILLFIFLIYLLVDSFIRIKKYYKKL